MIRQKLAALITPQFVGALLGIGIAVTDLWVFHGELNNWDGVLLAGSVGVLFAHSPKMPTYPKDGGNP